MYNSSFSRLPDEVDISVDSWIFTGLVNGYMITPTLVNESFGTVFVSFNYLCWVWVTRAD